MKSIPINMARNILPDLKMKGRVTRGLLGIRVQDIPEEMAQNLKLKEKSGALIAQVEKGSPADKAGPLAGDLVVEVNGKKIKDIYHIVQLVSSLRAGEKAIESSAR